MSDVEAIKTGSDLLRGDIAEELSSGTASFGERSQTLLKFHGTYQQDDRDLRKERRETGSEKAYQFMVRSRIPGGVLSAQQYLVHDELATRYGNGTLRLTTRQGIQLHGVLKGELRATIRAIDAALLTTLAACGDVNRNVMACPAPPATPLQASVAAAAHELAAHLTPRTRAYHELWLDGEKQSEPEAEPIYGPSYLPRKFKIALALPDDNCVDAFTQDLGFVAEERDGTLAGYTVLAGGGMGSTHGKHETYPRLATPLASIAPRELLEVAEAVVTVQRDYGDRANRKHARLKYLVQERGIDWLRGEVEHRIGRRLADPNPVRFQGARDHLGWHAQADGNRYLGLHVASGRIADRVTALVRRGIRAVLERHRAGVHLTPQQNLLLTGISPRDVGAVDALLRSYGVETDPAKLGIRRAALACPALPTCGLAVAEAERALPAVVDLLERELARLGLGGEEIAVRMTGCPNGCARPRTSEIGIVGRSLGIYDVFVGGDAAGRRLNEVLARGVPQNELIGVLRPLLQRWKVERLPGEAFGDFAARAKIESWRPAPLDERDAALVRS
ncbi:MAG TPA: NADPH-dependent assimilatory sulfite reductase hemoprotein subunit [Verrucomicrobiae bacterium]|nr:NADPH-dependent assimilatory sulfite reductase hemoprotein subunit [Verrucomicrobiae bacterium]